jgi:tetratricopeptide (TPR) repeat protein
MVSGKPESTAVSVLALKQMLDLTRAERVFLFIDASRNPPAGQENRIHQRIADELGNHPKVAGVLASEPKRLSLEQEKLQFAGKTGFGVFGHALISAFAGEPAFDGTRLMSRTGPPALEQVFEYVRKQVSHLTSARQLPRLLGSANKVSIWKTARAQPPPVLLAAVGSVRGLLPLQIFAGAEERQFTLMEELADKGQDIVARYGVADQFPDQPGKLVREDFLFAAKCFREAIALVPAGSEWDSFRATLTARKLFCEGRALAYDASQALAARKILSDAKKAETPPIPEIDNALGITYLEHRTTRDDLDAAIVHFRAAIARSPAWIYPRHNLALALIEKGEYSAAERQYRAAIKLGPYPYLHYNLALLLHRVNRTREADEEYNRAHTAFAAAERICAQRREQGVLDDATARATLQSFRRNAAEACNGHGALFAHMNKRDEAIRQFRRAIELNSNLYPARHNLAIELQKKAESKRQVSEEAIALLEETIARKPDFEPSRLELQRIRSLQ